MDRPRSAFWTGAEEMVSDRLKHFRTAEVSGGLSTPSPFSETWKKEKTCFLCQEKVGTGRGDTKKRKGCRFCLHALCEKCAPIKTLHPLTNREERICVTCFKAGLEQAIRQQFSEDLAGKNQELRALEEQLSTEIDAKVAAETRLKTLEREFDAQRESPVPADFHSQLLAESTRADSVEREFSTLKSDYQNLQQETQLERQTFEASLAYERQTAAKFRTNLIFQTAQAAGLKNSNENLRKQIEDLEKQLSGESGREEVIKRTKDLHAAEKLDLQKQLYAANEAVKEKSAEIERLNAACKDATLRLRSRDKEATERVNHAENEKKLLAEQLEKAVQQRPGVDQSAELKKQIEALKGEVMEMKMQLAERESLLSLAKEDILEENSKRLDLEEMLQRKSRKSGIDSDMERLKAELARKVEQWQLFQEEVRSVLLSLPPRESLEKQRSEVEQYKLQLNNCHQTIQKFDEVFHVVQEKLQIEQQVINEKEREVEALKMLLESHGIILPPVPTTDPETGTDLTTKLREREETIERLNAQMQEYKEEMKKLKNEKFRRSRPSALGKTNTLKPPLSQDPCDCRAF